MMNFKLDHSESTPLHDQVAAEIRRAIAEGEAAPGARIPPAVALAAVLGVNRNTVLRALRILRAEGTVDFTRGRGVRVTGTSQRSAVLAKASELLEFARFYGYGRTDVISLMESLP